MNEFDLIKHYFATQTYQRSDVALSIGDDAALVRVPAHHELVVTTDTLVADVHFAEDTMPYDIGYKSLAVNLSDLAAMGATPAWVTLAITLPTVNESWILEFCDGFFTLANRYQVQLIGGDLTRGPLSITVQAMGFVPTGQAILRSGAKAGDLIYVSGTLGDAGFGLKILQQHLLIETTLRYRLLERLNRPEPRIITGQHIRPFATAAIDISDGLSSDLSHILTMSQKGAIIYVDQLPISAELKHSIPITDAIQLALTAGDDYELCFTVPANKRNELEQQLATTPVHLTCIGEMTATPGLDLRYHNGNPYHGPTQGYQHF